MATPHTLIIGDDIGGGIYDSLSTIPGTGALWRDVISGSGIWLWADGKEIQGAVQSISNPGHGLKAPSPPDTAIVSLGRSEILAEPANISDADLQKIADDTKKVVSAIRAAKLKPLWILPPLVKSEGKTRATIAKALADEGVRAFPAQHLWSDTVTRGNYAEPLPVDTIDKMADLIATWAPLGGPRGIIAPRHATQDQPAGSASGLSSAGSVLATISPGGWWSGLSTTGKAMVGVGAIVAIGGSVYAVKRYG